MLCSCQGCWGRGGGGGGGFPLDVQMSVVSRGLNLKTQSSHLSFKDPVRWRFLVLSETLTPSHLIFKVTRG